MLTVQLCLALSSPHGTVGTQVRLRAPAAPATGFRGFTLSLTASQPAIVSGLIDAALEAGATPGTLMQSPMPEADKGGQPPFTIVLAAVGRQHRRGTAPARVTVSSSQLEVW
jgi:hypothetical protein